MVIFKLKRAESKPEGSAEIDEGQNTGFVETVAGGPRWYVKGKILDVQVDFLIDTGAHPNILRSDIFYSIPSDRRPVLHQSDMILRTASGDPMTVHGETTVGLMVDDRLFQVPVTIADTGNSNGILGMQFLVDKRCVIDLHQGILKIGNQEVTMNQLERTRCSKIAVLEEHLVHDSETVQGFVESSVKENPEGCVDGPQEEKAHVVGVVKACGSPVTEVGLVVPRVVVQGDCDKRQSAVANMGIDKTNVTGGTGIAEVQPTDEVMDFSVIDSNTSADKDLEEYDSDDDGHFEGTEHDDVELSPELMSLLCGSCKSYEDLMEATDQCDSGGLDDNVAPVAADEDLFVLDLVALEDSMDTYQSNDCPKAPGSTVDKSMEVAEQDWHETDVLFPCDDMGNKTSINSGTEAHKEMVYDLTVIDSGTSALVHPQECDCDDLPEHLHGMIPINSELDPKQIRLLCGLLKQYENIFMTPDGKLGRTGLVKHQIHIGDARPIKQAPTRLALAQKQIVEKEIEKMLANDVIEPSESSWASPVVLATKKDGSPRFCIDYRKLNQVTKKDAYPLPNINDCIDALSGSGWFSTLDLASGYWQVEMSEESKPLTAFVTHKGLYQFKVLPFGLTNAPAEFERIMEQVLRGLQWEKCLVYLDDIIIHGHDFQTALDNLKAVFDRIGAANLKLKPKKCNFFQKRVAFLGHVVTPDGVACDPAKTEAVSNWLTPQTVTEVRSFLGLASYYRRFINGFATTASPLTALTEKGRFFDWSKDCSNAFSILKKKLVEAPILAYPSSDPADPCILDTDASNSGIGAVLSQVQGGTERVIAYASKTLNHSQRRYCTTYRELLAVVVFVKHFRHYLIGQSFTVRTDHSSLRWLTNFKDAEGMVGRWISSLSPYDFVIEHRSGTSHGSADGLSRKMIKDKRRRCGREECPECPPGSASNISVITRGHNPPNNQQTLINWCSAWSNEDLRKMQQEDPDINKSIHG